jgi:hypothetical protein
VYIEESKPSSIQPNHVTQKIFLGDTAPASATEPSLTPVTAISPPEIL